MLNLGTVRPGSTIYIPFDSFAGSTGASITMSGFAVGDIQIYKDGGTTQRASTAGFTLLDTDGIDFDAITGLHGFSINLADNTTSGFYTAGSRYWIVISSITIDSQTVNFIAAIFDIGYPDATINTTIATLASQTSFTLTAGPAEDSALLGCPIVIHDIASAVQLGTGFITAYTGSTKTVTLAAGTTFTAAAGDNISVFRPALLPTTLGRTLDISAGGEAGVDWANVGGATTTVGLTNTTVGTVTTTATATNVTTVNGLAANVITAASIAADAIGASELAADAVTEIAAGVWQDAVAGDFTVASSIGKALYTGNVAPGAAGGHFIAGTNAATTITTALTTNITGNLSGSVGSVTGAVGSVTSNVGGNVVGSVGSVTAGVTVTTNNDKTGYSLLATTGLGNQTANITGNLSGSVGSVTGAVGSVTSGVTVTTNNDKTGYGLSSAAVQAIWDALTSALTTVGSIGKKLADWTIGTAQTGDSFARLGAPVGASISADIAGVQSDTNDIQTRLPAALVSGRIDASVGAMAANTLTASALATDAVTEIQSGLATAASISALNNISAAQVNAEVVDVLRTDTIPDSYAADGAQPTIAQAVLAILQFLTEKAVSGTTVTVRKPDGSTTAMTFTLDSGTTPSSITRAT